MSTNKEIQEAVSDIRQDVDRTKRTIMDVEENVSALSQSDEFQQPTNPIRNKKAHSIADTSNSSPDLVNAADDNDEPEIIFVKIVARNADSEHDADRKADVSEISKEGNSDVTRHKDNSIDILNSQPAPRQLTSKEVGIMRSRKPNFVS